MYRKYFTTDYQFVIVDVETGEVRTRCMDPAFADDPEVTFNELMADWIVNLIGMSTIYGFGTYQLFWCYDRSKEQYEGGTTITTMDELVKFYHWWMNNKY